MTMPLVAAFSASCSAKATSAPRPAASEGSIAARVTTGDPPVPASAVPPATTTPVPMAAAVVDTTANAIHRRGPRDHRGIAPVLLRDMGLVSLGTVEPGGAAGGADALD